MNIAGLGILLDVLGVLLCLLNHGFLNDDGFCEILEELVELNEILLNLLDVVVTGTDGAEDGGSGSCTVGLELWG